MAHMINFKCPDCDSQFQLDVAGYSEEWTCEKCADEYNEEVTLVWVPRYGEMSRVWLVEFDNGESIQPREKATVNPQSGCPGMYSASVDIPHGPDDDCEREITEDQIEGPIES